MSRIFQGFGEAYSEVKRDLAEMGIHVHPQTMQDKIVGDNPDYDTKELQNYMYTVTDALSSIFELVPNQPWADDEFKERVSGEFINPGKAWKHRPEIWTEYLHEGQFAYTYSERLSDQLETFIRELKQHPNSRQLYISIWDPVADPPKLGGQSRVPCSLGYLLQYRNGKLNMTYFMRSCDFITHFQNDAYLATRLMEYIAKEAGVEPGDFTHFMGSLHMYAKDAKGVF